MPQWIHTENYLIEYGMSFSNKSNKGFFSSAHNENVILFETDKNLLSSKMQEFRKYITNKQLEIKSTSPITTSMASYNAVYWKGQGGYGYGFGVSQIVGMLVLLQRIDGISEEEYQKRMERQQIESVLPNFREARDKAQTQVNVDNKMDTSIIKKKKTENELQQAERRLRLLQDR